MIGIVDYGVGNLFSLRCSFAAIGEEAAVSGDPEFLRTADKLILPGVGAFADAARKLRETGLDDFLREQTAAGKPLMGICLGMQLLFDRSLEFGEHEGLGLIAGSVVPIADAIPPGLKIPHIGWNALDIVKDSPLLADVRSGEYVYFVHSYYAAMCDEAVIARTEYGAPLTAAVQAGNVYGCQFHPEKSGPVGLRILKAFAAMKEGEAC